ncbi:chromosome segregation protein SMC [Anaerofustis stercorihominis]|uniref:chromosome segregation protein SMC n=1 Tax=Anaerofustis stercorihominis TaxID=214853 RepID=UPI00214B9203|nr:chromosome segregation protein SMC [Anaerofustis stercorihominis]MCR2032663.1 chromosome segregation protein SMC [Anaerofustis stercorihominis]
MYLKKVEIYGFKSFGQKVEIIFDNKVTGIVGPNGSGKSNIVDAIRWVLGEQRVKTLRGGKMEDVIFSGTEEKRALGYAFVSITIDNTTGILPSEYSEVNVSRRLYRSGESEYYINKNAVRLKDVHELFMDTGLSREGYSIISQGKIESIVNNSAVDRKLMIEEAVGIVKYKTRKNEALRKLDKTQNNLYRILDIISELEIRLPSLKRNSKKARKYIELSEELKGLELNLFVHKADKYKEELSKLDEDEKIMKDTLKEQEESISILDDKYSELKLKINTFDEQINNANKEIHDFISTYENSKVEVEVNKNKIETHLGNIDSLKEGIIRLEEEKETIENKKKETISLLNEQEILFDELTKEYNKLKEEVERLKGISNETENAIQRENINLKTKERLLKDKEGLLSDSLNRIENNKFIKSKLEEENDNLEKNIEELENSLKNVNNSENEEKLDKLDDENNKLLEERYKIEEAKADFREELLDKYNRVKLLKGQKDILSGYEENKEGYKFAIKKIFEYSKSNSELKNEVYGTLGDLISVEEKYMDAIQKSLASTIEHVIVKNEATASKAIKALKQNKWGRITFLPHNIIKPREIYNLNSSITSAKGFEGIGSDLVKYDKKFENIIKNALGTLLIFDNLNNANDFAKKSGHKYKIATLDGEVLFPGGALVGGQNKRGDEGLLSRKNKIDKLENEIKQAVKDYNEHLKKGGLFDEKLREKDEELKIKAEEINKLTLIISKEEDKNRDKEDQLENLIKTFEDNKKKISNLKEADKKIHEMNERSKEEVKKLALEIEEKKDEISKISLGLYKDKYLEMATKLNNEQLKLYKEEEKLRNYNSSIYDLNKNIRDIEKSLLDSKKEIDENEENILILKEQIEQAKEIDNDYDRLKQNLDDNYKSLIEKKKENSEDFDRVNIELKNLQEERFALSERIQKLENKKDKTTLEFDYLQRGIVEDYNLTYSQAVEFKAPIENMLEIETKVRDLKSNIKKLGNINVESIEEYKEVKERFEFLSEQKNDLENSKEELLHIIKDMNSKIEERFIKEFDNINIEFDNVFKKLFNGGSAKLILTNPDDIMESGIDIVAQPPKTKLKNISSLSGGEKSMTAIALIFAILKLKPAPFCVLDEIDAALDDANVARFCNYLKSIINDNQFIIVTHRKITMGIADVLYGATMGSEGITRIVSVKLKDIHEGGQIKNA